MKLINSDKNKIIGDFLKHVVYSSLQLIKKHKNGKITNGEKKQLKENLEVLANISDENNKLIKLLITQIK